jgi:hypothetical protein
MSRSKQLFFFVSVLLALIVPYAASGQTSTAITGLVTDQKGAMVPKASVTAHNTLSGQDLKVVSTSTGDFTFTPLRPGVYDISATAPGFNTAVETGINLHLDTVLTVKLVLKPGMATETMVVHADEVMLDVTHASSGITFTQDEMEQTPFDAGNPLMMVNAAPGVVFTGNISAGNEWVRPFDNGSINQFSVNGGVADSNDFQLDGSPNNANSFGARDIGYVPPTASIQEMKFITNSYDAQYGHTGGGIFDIVTKYGGNTLHGQVYNNQRATWLDANSHFNDALGLPKNSDQRYQRGFELDGPVVIPHLYNGHDKTFFAMQLELYKQLTPESGLANVPALSPGSTTQTVAQTGDFSADYWSDGVNNNPVTIYDPLTENTNGGCDCRTPFSNNLIPTGRLNKTSQAILSYLPLPNIATPVGQSWGIKNYKWARTETDTFDNAVIRVDHNFGEKDRTYIRFAWNKRAQNLGDLGTYNGIPGPAESGVFPLVRQNHFFTADWQHTFSANSLFDLHTSFTRYVYAQKQGPPFSLSKLPGSWGTLGSEVTDQVFPQIDMNGYTVFGDNALNGGDKTTITNTIAGMPMWTYVHGTHTFKAGIDYRLQRASSFVGGASSGTFYVDSEWTQQYSWGWTGPQGGDSVASMLLGSMDIPNQNGHSSTIQIAAKQYFTYPYYAPFVQDDWKVTRKLTVNLGVRWDLQGPPTESANKMVGDLNTTAINPVNSEIAAVLPGGVVLTGGQTFAGVNGQPRSLFNWNKFAFQPRLGFAYALTNKTVIRGGIGSTYMQFPGQGYNQGFSSVTGYNASNSNGLFPDGATIDNPFPTISEPQGSSLGLMTSLGNYFNVSNRNFKLPGVVNYSLGVERQIGGHSTVEVKYLGSTGFHLDSQDNINHISEGFAASCNLEMGATATTYQNCISAPATATPSIPQWITNPFQGVDGFSTAKTGNLNGYYTNPVISASAFTRPYPQFGDIIQTEQNDGETQFNSLQAIVSHHWHDALTAHGSFVWSKTMDSGALSDVIYRIRQHFIDTGTRKWRLTANADWHLPVGKGRTVLGNSNRVVDSVVGGWVIGAVYFYEAGTPAGVASNMEVIHKQTSGVHRTYEAGTHLIRAASNCVGIYNATPSAQSWNNASDPAYSLEPDINPALSVGCAAELTAPHDRNSYDFIVRPNDAVTQNVSDPGVYNPNGQNLDLSVSKSFPVWQRLKLETRFEGYNVLNHPSWNGHGYWWSPTDPHFGTINMTYDNQTNDSRKVQLSAKILW